MKPTGRLISHAAGILCLAASLCLVAQAQELSHARIVRLSFAEGIVTVHRPDVGEWAKSSVNTPIQEGFKVATDEAGFAEIEFENASTARIGQGTLLEFTQLALLPSGGKVNRLTLVQGYATFNVLPEGDDVYEVTAGTATMTPQGRSRFRVDLENGVLQVKVFKGTVEIMSPEGTGTLGKNTVLEIRPGSDQPFEISQGITKDDWDKWVEEREERTEMVRNMGGQRVFSGYTNNTNDLLWGAMDLMYYGTWFTDPSYGYGWVPTAGPGWSPYSHGRWTWYPGWGYTWIGNEPWGWLPYHYGSWMYNGGVGWCWFPTGGFGVWSPAAVQWYQGSGWVGWSPRGPVAGFDNHCPRSDGCVAITSDARLTAGQSIQPGDLRWGRHHDLGQSVERVDLSAGRDAMLTGTPYDFSRGFGRTTPGREPAGGISEGGIRVIGGTTGARPASGTPNVVYDPSSGSYVNNPAAPRTPANPGAPDSADISSGSARGGFSGGAQPGPANNYPAALPSPAWGRQGGSAPRGGSNGGNNDGIQSNAAGWGNGRGNSGSSAGSSSSSGGRSDSGSRATSGSSSSGSSSGGRSSSGNSGGWGGGGSSDSGRSSGGSSGGSSGSSSGSWGGGGSSGSSGGGGGGGHSSGGGFGGGGGNSSGGGGGGGGGHSSGGGGSSSSGSSRH